MNVTRFTSLSPPLPLGPSPEIGGVNVRVDYGNAEAGVLPRPVADARLVELLPDLVHLKVEWGDWQWQGRRQGKENVVKSWRSHIRSELDEISYV